MVELFEHQKEVVRKAARVLAAHSFVYLALEMRVGKTLIALTLARVLEARNVLFLTKKKAMSSITKDFNMTGYDFRLQVINYESFHRADLSRVDVLILDEAHALGTFPKPNDKARMIRSFMEKNSTTRVIFLSGTPSPESYSQLFHQLWSINRGPWKEYKSFYKWSGNEQNPNYVKVRKRLINGVSIADYTRADEARIRKDLQAVMISMDQAAAGFTNHEIREEVVSIEGPAYLKLYEQILTEDRLYTLKDGRVIICDTAVKLMQKLHQLWSGTILTDETAGTRAVQISRHKVDYITSQYQGQKIAVYYLFRAEGEMLRAALGRRVTEDPEEFNSTDADKVFISQIQSGSMGVNLSSADVLIFMNISFSATHYFQARARTGSRMRTKPQVIHWLFTSGGIEENIYKAVTKKKDYTLKYFRQDYGLVTPGHNEPVRMASRAC